MKTLNINLQNAILDNLEKQGGSDSISSLKTNLKYKGWKGLPSDKCDFEDMVKGLGFSIEYIYKKGTSQISKTLVTL